MHVSGDELAQLAIGEGSERERLHVQGCLICQDEVAALSDIARHLSEIAELRVDPPGQVWESIAAEVSGLPAQESSQVTPISEARKSRSFAQRWMPLAAAATVGAITMWAGLALGGDQEVATPLAEGVQTGSTLEPLRADMSPLETSTTTDGPERVVSVDASDLPDVGAGYLEVWLLNEDGDRMVPIGLLQNQQTQFLLPDNLPTDEFSILDISVEAYDGDPSHSGDSLWRGPVAR